MRALIVGVVVLGVLHCTAPTPSPAAGTERGPCYGNGTCNDGLTCASMLCVQLPVLDAGPGLDAGAGADAGALDAGVDAGPPVDRCGVYAQPFVCRPFDAASLPVADTSCNSEAVGTYIADCYGPAATQARCELWINQTPAKADGGAIAVACAICLDRWVTPASINTEACILRLLGNADAGTVRACRDAFSCFSLCSNAACTDALCDTSARDPNGDTEKDRCFATTPAACQSATSGGANASSLATACLADPAFRTRAAACLQITNTRKIELFFRGACRNGGDFSAAATSVD